jgi:hypothetical protein
LISSEFVEMVEDDPNEKIKLKEFHCQILNDEKVIKIRNEHLQRDITDMQYRKLCDTKKYLQKTGRAGYY